MNEEGHCTILCLASYFKGGAFLEACKEQGCHVILLTKEKLADEEWPWAAIDERFLMPDLSKRLDVLFAVSYLARSRRIDRIIPLDDFDVETAAALREHLRIPGMGETTARYFRDKLAMRVQAREKGILVPDFSPVINYDDLRDFMATVPAPWVLKPRSQAGAMGIKKLFSEEEVWRRLDELGDQQSFFVLEQFVPGDIYHVDAIVTERAVVFAEVHKYMQPPLQVSHEGGVFISRTVSRESAEALELKELVKDLMAGLGMLRGVSHTEFIRSAGDGRFYFLETAARVGGANIAEMVEHATGVNLWREWAAIELANLRGKPYQAPEAQQNYAGILICLARQEYPDLSVFTDPEVAWRLHKRHHAGLIVASSDQARVESLLRDYSRRFAEEFLAYAPPLDEAPL
ncbi:MAG: ATP-grasp domain-containing protein [Candidatus Promineifilaceae bacterium]